MKYSLLTTATLLLTALALPNKNDSLGTSLPRIASYNYTSI